MDAFPLVLPTDSGGLRYQGFFTAAGREHALSFALPDAPSGSAFSCDSQLFSLLQGFHHVVQQRLTSSKTAEAFMVELVALIKRVTQGQAQHEGASIRLCTAIVSELEGIGWDHVVALDNTLRKITLAAPDIRGELHELRVEIPARYPSAAPTCAAALPAPFRPAWHPGDRLASVYSAFIAAIHGAEAVWDALRAIDAVAWVLEPATPSPAIVTRRIALNSSTSIHLELDPAAPRAAPQCRLLGPAHAVDPMREALARGLSGWNDRADILTNLSRILNVQFPGPPAAVVGEEGVECTICYCPLLDGAAPDVACEQKPCAKLFHSACLVQWLLALPTTRRSFRTLFGECPYCATPLSVEMERSI
eukprot:m.32791 g.32791  ORF g.32791 m.32791 type:complete len:363 (-) comp5037_c0_seq1:317-1405(-)